MTMHSKQNFLQIQLPGISIRLHHHHNWVEAGRESYKVLHEISSNYYFNDDTLCNALIECEKVINCRLLTYIDLETGADEALTPKHFLLGSSNGTKPLIVFNPDDLNSKIFMIHDPTQF